jgi:hypothetical protein
VRRLALLGCIALAGCATATTYRGPAVTVAPTAQNIATANGCSSGSQDCIDGVVAEMQRRYAVLARSCDHRAAFALMYMRVTQGVKQPSKGRFGDERYLRRLDAQFAHLYFKAFDAYQAGKPTDPAWRTAFDAARLGQTTGIGDMLLGMNAHISNDLPFALLSTGLTEKGGRSAQTDFDAVNNLLGDVQKSMIEEESRLLDPTVARATLPYLGVRGGDIATVIAGWRTEAWQNALKLEAAAPGVARRRVAAKIRAEAGQRAQVIRALASNRLLGADARSRDTFCRTRGAGAHPPA